MSDALVIAPIGPLDHAGAITAALRRNGEVAQLGEFGLHAAELSDLPRVSNRPTVLRLTRADVLEKTLTLPLAAQADLNQVLAFEMGLETPFEPEDLYWNHRVETVDRQHSRLVVRLMLLPKVALAPLLSALAQVGILPRWVEISEGGEFLPVLPLDGDATRSQHRSHRLFWPAAVCCGLLGLGALATPFVRQAVELTALDREVAAGRSAAAHAQRLRDEIDRLSGSAELVRNELGKAGRPLEVLASVTRVLPDDTYLTEIGLRQRKLTLSGRSAGAARLIGALAADGFRNPTFAAPVTRLEALHAEVFTIITEVGPSP
jgi:general secretion pathway protein L